MVTASGTGTKGVPRAQREAQILDAAVSELARSGFSGASMVAIASAAGITKPLLYQYFGSKEGLCLAALTRTADELLGGITQAMAEAPQMPWQPIAVLRAVFRTLEPRRTDWAVVFDPTLPAGGAIAQAVRYHRDLIGGLALQGSVDLLALRGNHDALDASALAAMWMSSVSTLIDWWIGHPDHSADQMCARAERLFGAFSGRGGPRPGE